MGAPVRIEARAWTDIRFAKLARYLGLTDPDFALIKVARLWSWQTEHYTQDSPTYCVSQDDIEAVLGDGGAAALVRAGLATETPEGYRIHGTEGQIEWCDDLTSKRQRAGKARAESARRGQNGRLLSKQDYSEPAHAGCAGPAPTSTPPAQSSAPSPSPKIEDLSPACAPGAGLPGGAEGHGAGAESAQSQAVGSTSGFEADSSPDRATGSKTALACPRMPGEQADLAERRAAQNAVWRELVRERNSVISERGLQVPPLAAVGDPAERDLAALYREQTRTAAEREALTQRLLHRIRVAGAEARRDGDVQWFSSLFRDSEANRRRDGMTVEQARSQRAPPGQRPSHLHVVPGIRKTKML